MFDLCTDIKSYGKPNALPPIDLVSTLPTSAFTLNWTVQAHCEFECCIKAF